MAARLLVSNFLYTARWSMFFLQENKQYLRKS